MSATGVAWPSDVAFAWAYSCRSARDGSIRVARRACK